MFLICACFVVGEMTTSAGIVLSVSLDTSSLAGSPGPYTLRFQLVDNTSTSNAVNLVLIDQLDFGGGFAGPGAPQIEGGGSGNLLGVPARAQLVDSAFINAFSQRFQPGTNLSFRVSLTANCPVSGPDAFSLSILGTNGLRIPTESRVDEFVRIDLSDKKPALKVFRSDPTNVIYNIPAPAAGVLIITNSLRLALGAPMTSSTNGLFQMDFPGAKIGNVFELEASANLQNWTNLGLRAYVGLPIIFADPDKTNYPARFYRVRFLNP